jgi:dTDP-4-dehydrorhamnose 3,5-epimerase
LNFAQTPLQGVLLVRSERSEDLRGHFIRLWCRQEFRAQGLDVEMVQASHSHNSAAGTLRGMHFQWPPSREAKLVRCQRGRIHDVIIDLRPHSATFTRHFAVTLDAHAGEAMYIPPGFAHGFQTLDDDCDVLYMMSDYYRPDLQAGVRWNDAAFGIAWPRMDVTILPRDAAFADFDERDFAAEYARRDALREPA